MRVEATTMKVIATSDSFKIQCIPGADGQYVINIIFYLHLHQRLKEKQACCQVDSCLANCCVDANPYINFTFSNNH